MSKYLIALILIAVLTVSVMIPAPAEERLMGGWTIADPIELTPERMDIFDKGLENLVGVDYTPIAYLGSQVVAGVNHCFLCKAKAVYPGAEAYLALVYLYQNPEGEVSVLNIVGLDIGEISQDGLIGEEWSDEPFQGE